MKTFWDRGTGVSFETIVYKDSRRIGVYQYYQRATHVSQNHFFLYEKNRIIIIKKDNKVISKIKYFLISNNFNSNEIDKCINEVTKIIEKEKKRPSNSF